MLSLEKLPYLRTLSSAQPQRRSQTLLSKTQKNRKLVNQAHVLFCKKSFISTQLGPLM